MIKGQAGSGKSTIADVLQYYFDPSQVGHLANRCQETFALSTLIDHYGKRPKKLGMCTEVKEDFRYW